MTTCCRHRKAFTLIEIMIAISVLAILSTTAIYSYGSVRRKGRDARRVADISSVMTAMNAAEREGVSLAGPCTGLAGPYALNNCSLALSESAFDFTRLADPSSNAVSLCTPASTAVCQYSIQGASAGVAATPSAYRIYFFIETTGGSAAQGLRTATAAGIN